MPWSPSSRALCIREDQVHCSCDVVHRTHVSPDGNVICGKMLVLATHPMLCTECPTIRLVFLQVQGASSCNTILRDLVFIASSEALPCPVRTSMDLHPAAAPALPNMPSSQLLFAWACTSDNVSHRYSCVQVDTSVLQTRWTETPHECNTHSLVAVG